MPLFPYFSSMQRGPTSATLRSDLINLENGWQIVPDKGIDFVSLEEGTGIVHMAPAFGEDDMQMGEKHKLPFIQHVDENGRFLSAVKDWAGEDVKPKGDPQKTDKKIVAWLEEQGKLFEMHRSLKREAFQKLLFRSSVHFLNFVPIHM